MAGFTKTNEEAENNKYEMAQDSSPCELQSLQAHTSQIDFNPYKFKYKYTVSQTNDRSQMTEKSQRTFNESSMFRDSSLNVLICKVMLI